MYMSFAAAPAPSMVAEIGVHPEPEELDVRGSGLDVLDQLAAVVADDAAEEDGVGADELIRLARDS